MKKADFHQIIEDNFDKLGEECGIFGGFSKKGDIKEIVRNGLFKLQHRGQESCRNCCFKWEW